MFELVGTMGNTIIPAIASRAARRVASISETEIQFLLFRFLARMSAV